MWTLCGHNVHIMCTYERTLMILRIFEAYHKPLVVPHINVETTNIAVNSDNDEQHCALYKNYWKDISDDNKSTSYDKISTWLF